MLHAPLLKLGDKVRGKLGLVGERGEVGDGGPAAGDEGGGNGGGGQGEEDGGWLHVVMWCGGSVLACACAWGGGRVVNVLGGDGVEGMCAGVGLGM